jgi:hypothetical protein
MGDAGVPPYICGGGICVSAGGSCTTTADCCAGLPCVAVPGSSRGVCGNPPPPPPDGGYPPPGDSSIPDVYVPPPGCAEYGQVCTMNADCCNSLPCVNGRCGVIVN